MLEDLYRRVVRVYSRCIGRGGLELASLSALRGVLADVRAAAGEVEGEVLMRVTMADGTPVGKGVLVPKSKVASWPEDGVIRLGLKQGPSLEVDVDPRLLPPEQPNGKGHRGIGSV